MEELRKTFQTLKEENPGWSSYVTFACSINGLGLSNELVKQGFEELVERSDYHPRQKEKLLVLLYEQTKA